MHTLKIRIDLGRTTAIGPGKAELLALIIETGSISAAAKRMRMSYRRAWELVDTMNRCFDQPLVSTSTGGVQGGGAVVTPLGHAVLRDYLAIVSKAAESAAPELAAIARHLRKPDPA